MKECWDNFVKLKAFYGNITLDAHVIELRAPYSEIFPAHPDANLKVSILSDYSFWAHGEKYYRLDEKIHDISRQSPPPQKLGIITPTNYYLLEQLESINKYALTHSGEIEERAFQMLYAYRIPCIPFAYAGYPLDRCLFHKLDFAQSYRIEKVECIKEEGEEVVVVSVRLDFKLEGKGSLLFTFYKDRAWALKECIATLPGNGPNFLQLQKSHNVYRGEKDGIPLIKEHLYEVSVKSTGENKELITSRYTYRFENVVPGPVDLKTFDVDAILKKDIPASRFVPSATATPPLPLSDANDAVIFSICCQSPLRPVGRLLACAPAFLARQCLLIADYRSLLKEDRHSCLSFQSPIPNLQSLVSPPLPTKNLFGWYEKILDVQRNMCIITSTIKAVSSRHPTPVFLNPLIP